MYSLVNPSATIISVKKALLALIFFGLTGCGGASEDVVRRASTEGSEGVVTATGAPGTSTPTRTVVFLGTSLTAGYGLDDPDSGYTAGIQRRIDAAGLPFVVVNAGVSGDTSRGGLERIDWVLRSDPEVLVVELGANDALRGIDPDDMRVNLQAIFDRARARRPDVELALVGMEAPPNMGAEYGARFRTVFAELAAANDALLLPFLLQGVGGIAELNQADGIHPTAEGHEIMAETVWTALGPLLNTIGPA